MELYSLQSKSRVDSFDSVDSSFDVISVDESIEEQDAGEVLVEKERDDEYDGEWEDLEVTPTPEDVEVEIELDEGFEDAIEAALEASITEAIETGSTAPHPAWQVTSPRSRKARESLRDFYLARAKTSEESSKHFRSYTPPPFVAPVEIAPLRAPQRYDVELYERVVREENERKAQQALREFYAEREAMKAQRAAENRANERFVYESQIGSSTALGGGSCTQALYWETTRFVVNGNEANPALST